MNDTQHIDFKNDNIIMIDEMERTVSLRSLI